MKYLGILPFALPSLAAAPLAALPDVGDDRRRSAEADDAVGAVSVLVVLALPPDPTAPCPLVTAVEQRSAMCAHAMARGASRFSIES